MLFKDHFLQMPIGNMVCYIILSSNFEHRVVDYSSTTRAYVKGGLKSESAGGFFIVIINIPFYYFKLLHPLHGINKILIVKKFTFTCLIYYRFKK